MSPPGWQLSPVTGPSCLESDATSLPASYTLMAPWLVANRSFVPAQSAAVTGWSTGIWRSTASAWSEYRAASPLRPATAA